MTEYNYPNAITTTSKENALTHALYQGQEVERKRIARELHDSIGCLLSTTIMLFDTLHATNTKRYKEVRGLLSDTQTELRRIVQDLFPASLEKFGLIATINQLCLNINHAEKFYVVFNYDEILNSNVLEREDSIHVYRIVQELLNNSIKYSKAFKINLNLHFDSDNLIIDLREFFDEKNKYEKIEFKKISLEERVNNLGGKIKILKKRNGIEIVVNLPIAIH